MSKLPTCTRLLQFDAAHREKRHESKCRMLHGHRYGVEATFSAKELDDVGRIIDFGVVKQRLGGWIDANWDHATVLAKDDDALGENIASATGQKIYYMDASPTAENMAMHLLHDICPTLFADTEVVCVKIRLWETPNCYADAEL